MNKMQLDTKRLKQYLMEIEGATEEIQELLASMPNDELLKNPHLLKSIKYSLIEIAEAISLVLQHILARRYKTPVKGYIDTIARAKAKGIIDEDLYARLRPFFDFRNALIHRYWEISDEVLLQNTRQGYKDFIKFVENIKKGFL